MGGSSSNDGGVGGSSSSSQAGMTGSERTAASDAKSEKSFGESLSEAKAENERGKSPNDDGGTQTERAAGPPGIGAPPSKPDTKDTKDRPQSPTDDSGSQSAHQALALRRVPQHRPT